MRINKYIASCGVCSRRKAEELILSGQIKVNGEICTTLSTDIKEGKDKVLLNDQEISLQEEKVYYMLNKPKGYVTTMSDDRNRKSIVDLTTDIDKRVFPIGRLDYDSEGLLLLTNDGELTNHLTHPKYAVPKKYIVKVEGEMKESELAVLRAGVVVDGVRYNKCKVKLVKFEENISKMEITLDEGKNREIRKMFQAIGKDVIFLKRVEMAGVKLGGLKRGEIRPLKSYEIETLKQFELE